MEHYISLKALYKTPRLLNISAQTSIILCNVTPLDSLDFQNVELYLWKGNSVILDFFRLLYTVRKVIKISAIEHEM